MFDPDKYQEFLSDTKATIQLLTEDRDKAATEIAQAEVVLANIKEAQEIMGAVGILAQDNTKQIFEGLVTQALQAVFGQEYSFELESRFSRNKPEIELFVVENGVRYSPKDEKGGGIIDIISFALRIVSWAIREPRSQNVLVLDEPFRCMHKSTLSFLSEMMQKVSDELGLQIICITHENDLSIIVRSSEKDKAFYVRQSNGISEVSEVEYEA